MKLQMFLGGYMLLLVSCSNNGSSNPMNAISGEESFRMRSVELNASLKGKSISSLDSMLKQDGLLKQNGNVDDLLIFYFSLSDCFTCIEKGMAIRDSLGNGRFKSIAVLKGVRFEKAYLSRFSQLIHDEKYLIDDEIGFVQTPSLINYSNQEGIKEIYPIPIFKDSVSLKKFIDGLYEK
ncbi:hypothetical protein [Roseivirga pacifica]|uniref:hypothetical protein n=1 Tax=Roseivirga pacifica TaxID=1267423 RepID=UPI003BAF87BD